MEHAYGLDIPRTLEEVCDPRRTALLVYDMQIGILSQVKDGDRIIASVSRVLQAARAARVRVFWSRHLSLPKEIAGVMQLRTALAWQHMDTVSQVQPWFLRDSPGFQITPELAPLPSEGMFDKITMSALEGTYLDIALRDCGLNALVLVGIALEVGIEPTARHAADLGYFPIIVSDACGAGHAEAAQRSVESLKYSGDSLFTDTETICRLFSQETQP